MEVDAPAPWALEDSGCEDAAVGDHQRDVGVLLADPGGELRGADLDRLLDVEAELEGAGFDRRGFLLEAAARGAIRLADDGADVSDLGEGREGGDGDGGGSEEEGAHGGRV